MIVQKTTQVSLILKELEKLPFDLHWTGSQFFGTNHEESDCDFIMELPDGSDWIGYFLKLGFWNMSREHAKCPEIIFLLRHPLGIDIHVVQNSATKVAIQELIAKYRYLSPNNKSQVIDLNDKESRRIFWNFLNEVSRLNYTK